MGARLIMLKNTFAANRHAILILVLVKFQRRNSFEQAIATVRGYIATSDCSEDVVYV